VRALKALYPDATVVCYINSTAEVKAECDVCVTSGNVYDIVAALPASRVIFVPDRLMAENLRSELRRRGVAKEIISSDGTCMVHDQFTTQQIEAARRQFPGLRVVAHPECPPDEVAAADFVGQHGAMMNYVKRTAAPYFLMLTECGLVGGSRWRSPRRLCRRLPALPLHEAEFAREDPRRPGRAAPDQIVELDEALRLRRRSLHRKDV
jgi:quinolinate synthase